MNKAWEQNIFLPSHMQDELVQFCGTIEETEGDNLVTIVLYGSAVKGGYNEHTSDINVLLVLQDVSIQVLDRLAEPIHYAAQEFGIAVMVSEPKDLNRSTDVFPIKFRDIQLNHVILVGEDVLEPLQIDETHLRLRCEQEFKNLMWRMRYFYLHRKHRPELIEATILSVFSNLLMATETLLYLQTGQHLNTKEKIIEQAVKELDYPKALLKKLMALQQTKLKPKAEELKEMYEDLMQLVAFAADLADRFEPDEEE